MAAMSVIGIDFGNESCYVAVARAGGIETIANDYSLRATPSCVAFSGRNRILGVAAKNQLITNMKNTIYNFKRLLGRKFTDPHVQHEIKHLPFRVVQQSNGTIGIKVHYQDEDQVFSPEQITAMLLTKLKDTSEIALKTKVNDCVISVPSYFTNAERNALLDAAAIAGLNVLRLMNETTATALAYGIYKQDLPAAEDKPRNVVFVDCGHASLQVFTCAFHKGKLKMLSSAAIPNLGGRDIDLILAECLSADILSRYRVDARTNPRAFTRLLAEAEKLKKQMSANSTRLPLNIECFMDDKDVHSEMKRSDMESMCAHLFTRVELTLRKCLEDSRLRLEDIYAVEIVGGSSRIPAIKSLIETVFGKTASTTLNQDEAVARGCALQCAMLSPAVRVREFSVGDIQNYPVKLVWDASMGEDGEMEVFTQHHPAPFSKMLTFYRKEPFTMKAFYSAPIPYPDPYIGQFTVKDVKPTAEGESAKVKVKVRINIHGIVAVSSAALVEKRDANDAVDTEPSNEGADAMEASPAPHSQENGTAADQGTVPEEEGEKKDGGKKKKQVTKTVDLPIEALTHGYTQAELNNYTELECKMIASDRQEKERVDARNALEEYVYELRGKLGSDGELYSFISDGERNTLLGKLDSTEAWLYEEEGEQCNRQVYAEKLTALKCTGEPIKTRRYEFESRCGVLEEFGATLQLSRKTVELWRTGDERYKHIENAEMDKVARAIEQSSNWLDEKRAALVACPRTADPPITVATIRHEKQTFEQTVTSVLNKPKPKPAEPANQNATANHNQSEDLPNNSGGDNNAQKDTTSKQENMDVE